MIADNYFVYPKHERVFNRVIGELLTTYPDSFKLDKVSEDGECIEYIFNVFREFGRVIFEIKDDFVDIHVGDDWFDLNADSYVEDIVDQIKRAMNDYTGYGEEGV